MLKRLAMAGALFAPTGYFSAKSDNQAAASFVRNAICILYPNGSEVKGIVSFSQDSITSPTKIVATVRGLTPNNKHGIHIHEFGDLTEGCKTAGPHYKPFNKRHGGLDGEERHVGDLGNISADYQGTGYLCIKTAKITLFGENSVVGRSVVVHANEDDEGRGNNE